MQWDSDKGLNGWGVDFINILRGVKAELPEISEDISAFFDLINDGDISLFGLDENGIKDLTTDLDIADESLIKFLQDTNYATKDLANYQLYLKKTGKATSALTTFTKKAGTALKSLAASLASMAAMWAIGEVISIVVNAIDYLASANKRAVESLENNISKTSEQIDKYDEEISTLESLQSKLIDAKGNKAELKKAYEELNTVLGNSIDGIEDESSKYKIANELTEKRIALLKEEREEKLKNKISDQKELINSRYIDRTGKNVSWEDLTNATIELQIGTNDNIKTVTDNIKDIIQNNMSVSDQYKGMYFALNNKDDVIEAWTNHFNATEETFGSVKKEDVEKLFDENIKEYQNIFSEYISSYEGGIFDAEQLNDLIEWLVLGGCTVDEVYMTLEKVLYNKDFSDIYNQYIKSLSADSNLNTDELRENLIKKAEELVKDEPLIKFFIDKYISLWEGLTDYSSGEETNKKSNNAFLSAFNSLDFSEQKEQLLELAKAGELTPETLESVEGYNTLLIETGFNSSKAVGEINKLIDATSRLSDMSSDLSSLGTAYKEFKEDGFVSVDSIEALREKFGKLKDFNGKSLFEGFANVVGSADSSVDDKQQEFNKLATSYLLQERALGKLTEANKDYYITQLKSMGIVNAESLVIQQLEADTQALLLKEKAFEISTNGVGQSATAKMNSLLQEASATNLCRIALFQLDAQEKIFNTSTLDPEAKIKSLLELASTYGITSTYLERMQASLDAYNNSGGHSGLNFTEADMKNALEYIYNGVYADFFDEENGFKLEYEVDIDDSKSKSNTVFDWIEIKLENIAKKTDKLKEKFENSFKLSSTNTNFKKYLNQISSEISSNEKAISKYDAKLRSIGLDKKYVDKIKLGDYSIDDKLPEKTQEKISEYQKWYDKKIACEEKILEKEKERAEAENSYAEKRVKYYEDEISKIESLIDKREKLVGIKESIGLSASKSDYSYSVNKSSEEISRLKKQAEELKKLQKGVEEGSDAWNTYQEGIESNNEKILDLIESIADLAEKLAQLPLDKARKITENNANKSELYSLKSDNSNSYGSKNNYLDKQTQLAKSDAKAWSNALKNAQNNIKTLWYSGSISSARKTSANKNKKEGELLSTAGLVVGSDAYKAVVKYNKAVLAKKEAELESAKATENATKTLRENTKAKYDNMANAYSIKRDVYSSQADRFQSKLDYIDAKNMKNDKNLVKSTYNSILKASKNELSVLEDERKKYDLDKIRKQYENGELSLDDYRELVSYVNELDSSIYDAKTNLEELKDTIREETVFKPFVEMREDIEKTIDSVEKLISLINDDSLFNDEGSLTSLGTAKFSLLSQQLNKSKETIQSYQDQIKAATEKYQEFLNGVDNGYSEEEYQKDIQELNSGLLDSLIESKSITDEIISMHTQQQQAIIDSIKEEINARSEALQKKKEYYDYDKQIRTKTKDIQALEAQKAALLATEDSLEKRRKLLELEEELNNKREELEETQKEHEINLVVNGLNDFSDDIQNQFDEYTKNLSSSFEEQIKIIQNANLMYSQGYDSIFKTLNDVLGFYGSQFDASSFTPNLAPTTSTLTPTNMIDLSSMDGFINSNITPILTLPKLNIPDVENRANSSNIDINFGNLININGNANSETVDELKRMMPKITKQVTNSIVEDLRKNGFK